MTIPVIDFSIYNENELSSITILAKQIEEACENIGFFSIVNSGITAEIIDRSFTVSQSFFTSSLENKNKLAYTSAEANFGYQGLGQETLSTIGTPDVKETLTMRDLLRNKNSYLLADDLRATSIDFYKAAMQKVYELQFIFAHILQVERDFFIKRHNGYCTTLRMLYYPTVDTQCDQQFGAGEHTDYGMFTLLFQDDVEGLEVQDKQGNWLTIPANRETIVVNCGDLLQRWTNDRFISTKHRVRPNTKAKARQSIALFVDPDPEVNIECLSSCCTNKNPAKYDKISAGDFIQKKILATHQ